MDQRSLDRFRQRAALFKATPARKIIQAPWRMAWSFAIQKMCFQKGRIVRTTAQTFWGRPMNVVLPEPTSSSIYRYGFFEEGLTATFIKILKPGMTVFDVGAHFGYFSLLASELVEEIGQVHSFEPTPSTFEILKSNVGHRRNVTLNNAAMFSEETDMQFQDYGVVYSSFNSLQGSRLPVEFRDSAQEKQCTVRALTLDGYIERLGRAPDFIKIDAENAELEILHGMTRTLAQNDRPIITLEVGQDSVTAGQSAGTLEFLVKHGYHIYEYNEAKGTLSEHEIRPTYRYDNVLMVPPERISRLPEEK